MIHRQNCGNLAEYRKQPEKWLSVAWEGTHGPAVQLRDPAGDQQPGGRAGGGGIRASPGTETNIDQVSLEERDVSSSSLEISAAGARPQAPGAVIRTIRRMPDVQRVFRTLA